MKTYTRETQLLLTSVTNTPVYLSVVPEGAALPAIAWYSLGSEHGRTLDASRPPEKLTQRVMIIVDRHDMESIDNILSELDILDGASTDVFQDVSILFSSVEPTSVSSPYVRTMVDLQLRPR